MTGKNANKGSAAEQNEDAAIPPEPETLQTPDPQDKLKALSSLLYRP